MHPVLRALALPRSILILFMLLAVLPGCARRTGDIAYNPSDFRAPDAPPPAQNLSEYKLSPGDVINVRVFELETLTGDQTVDQTGRVTLPLIGAVVADGRTTSQFEADIATRLQKDYLQSPHVVVALKAAVARTVTVDGAVQQPGVYAVAPTTTLIQTIALARGVSRDANPKRVVVFRQIGGVKKAAAFDLVTIRNGKDPDPAIYASDVIVVDGSGLNSAYRTLLSSIPLLGFATRF